MAGWDLPATPALAPGAGSLTAHLRELGDAGRWAFAEFLSNLRQALDILPVAKPAGGRRVARPQLPAGCVGRSSYAISTRHASLVQNRAAIYNRS